MLQRFLLSFCKLVWMYLCDRDLNAVTDTRTPVGSNHLRDFFPFPDVANI